MTIPRNTGASAANIASALRRQPANVPIRSVLALAVMCGSPTHAAFAVTPEEIRREQAVQHAPPADLLRDYARVTCLGRALPKVGAEATAAANSYVQYGRAPQAAYQEVDAAADEFLKRPYESIVHADMSVMKCLDFVKSQSLASIVQKYFPSPAPGNATRHGPR